MISKRERREIERLEIRATEEYALYPSAGWELRRQQRAFHHVCILKL